MSLNRDEVIATLQAHQQDLRQRGVLHAAVFGSVARREERPDSDVDILIELDPDQSLDVFAYVGLKRFIAELFPLSVDVINEAALRQGLRGPVRRDAAYAF